jgi:hypothetical protein
MPPIATRAHGPLTIVLASLLLCGALGLQAQEVTVLAGTMRTLGTGASSYSYQVDYSQSFYRNLTASMAYLNEGHVQDHHRDGTAFQVWGRVPFDQNRFAVSVGAGAYYYYDTQLLAGVTRNVHGTAPVLSVAGVGYFSDRWFGRAVVNRLMPAGELKTTTAVVGIGYWFGREDKPTPHEFGHAPGEKGYVSESELTVFGGQSVVNTFFNPQGRAWAMEFRRGFMRHLDWTATVLYEGDPQIVRRSGFAAQAWAVNAFFGEQVTVGLGFGPYFYIDRKHPAAGRSNPAEIAPLASLTLSDRLADHWVARLRFDRVTSNYNRDADIFLLGLGYRWTR